MSESFDFGSAEMRRFARIKHRDDLDRDRRCALVPFAEENMFARDRNCAKSLDTSERWFGPHRRCSSLCGPAITLF
jgi:hypothetical protein